MLARVRLLQVQLNDSSQDLDLHHYSLVLEIRQECIEQLVCIVDLLGVFAQDPDQTGFCLGLVEIFEVRAERGDDAFVSLWVFPEDVLEEYRISKSQRGRRGMQKCVNDRRLTLITMIASCTT